MLKHCLCGSVCAFAVTALWASEIIPDGSTATQVHHPAAAAVQIVPAAVTNDVSYNAFEQFDVSATGAQFLNQDVAARTIVAEVFSAGASRIAGPVEVLGPRANLVFANSSGIVINGGRFINFGKVALTTGAVALRDERLAGEVSRRYVDLTTTAGFITVDKEGLAANLIGLELIARQIELNGDVTNEFSSPTAQTRLVAGNTKTHFDTASSPSDNLTPWAYHQGLDASEEAQAVTRPALHLSAEATVTSGRVDIVINEQGAGFRNEGELVAEAGHFSLSSSGEVVQHGGRIRAAGDVRIEAARFEQNNTLTDLAKVAASGQTLIRTSGDIINRGGEISGGVGYAPQPQEPQDDEATPSQTNASEQRGQAEEQDGEVVAEPAQDRSDFWGVELLAGGRLEHGSEPGATQPGVIFGRVDGVRIEAQDGVSIQNGRIVSNGSLRIDSPQDITHVSRYRPGAGPKKWNSHSVWRRHSGYQMDLGQLEDSANLAYLVANGDIRLDGRTIQNLGGYIFSNDGKVHLKAAETITVKAHNAGQYKFSRKCVLFLCKRKAHSSQQLVGGQVLAAKGQEWIAAGHILNDGGEILATEGDIRLDAPHIIARSRELRTAIDRPEGLKTLFGGSWARMYAADQGGRFTAQQGRLMLTGKGEQDGGLFNAELGIDGSIEVLRLPHKETVSIDSHLGILWW